LRKGLAFASASAIGLLGIANAAPTVFVQSFDQFDISPYTGELDFDGYVYFLNYNDAVTGGFISGSGLTKVTVDVTVFSFAQVGAKNKVSVARHFTGIATTQVNGTLDATNGIDNAFNSLTVTANAALDATIAGHSTTYGAPSGGTFTLTSDYTSASSAFGAFINGTIKASGLSSSSGDAKPDTGGNYDALIDNEGTVEVKVTYEAVPEPASLAVLGLGAAALIRRRRSR
jgi:hypothetical protein